MKSHHGCTDGEASEEEHGLLRKKRELSVGFFSSGSWVFASVLTENEAKMVKWFMKTEKGTGYINNLEDFSTTVPWSSG